MTTKPDEIWTTLDGRKLAVGDMDEDHVRNALRMVIRRSRKRKERLAQLQRLSGPRLLEDILNFAAQDDDADHWGDT